MDDGYKDGALENNGNHRAAGPYSGGKYSVLEGGTRTPFITRWKGRVPAGESDELVCTIDMAASFATLAGAELKKGACIDSFNVLGAMLGERGAKGRDYLVQQDNGRGNNYGLRVGNWKLQRHDSKKARNVKVEVHLVNTNVARYRLFDLSNDPGEKKNVIDAHPEVAKRLIAQLEKVISDGRSRP